MESGQKAGQTLELWTDGHDSPDGHLPEDAAKPKRRRTAFLSVGLVLVVIAATAATTYGAIDNNWMPEITGSFHSEDEHQAVLSRASEAAHEEGYSEGHTVGWDSGELNGFAEGQDAGHEAGYREGRTDGYNDGYSVGYNSGGSEAYDDGYHEGYGQGWTDGCLALFDGLSTDRVGDWWDYYYSSAYGSYFNTNTCG